MILMFCPQMPSQLWILYWLMEPRFTQSSVTCVDSIHSDLYSLNIVINGYKWVLMCKKSVITMLHNNIKRPVNMVELPHSSLEETEILERLRKFPNIKTLVSGLSWALHHPESMASFQTLNCQREEIRQSNKGKIVHDPTFSQSFPVETGLNQLCKISPCTFFFFCGHFAAWGLTCDQHWGHALRAQLLSLIDSLWPYEL